MLNNVNFVPIVNLLDHIVDNRGKSCPTVSKGFPLIATNCIKDYRIYPVFENIRYVSDDTLKNWFRDELKPNDILFVNKGTPGRVCIVPNPLNFCAAQDMIGLRANPNKVYYKYLYFVLKSDYVQNIIKNYHVGVAIPHFKKSDLHNLLIPIIPMKEQIKIGNLYCDILEKIELNYKCIRNYNEIVSQMYKYWFLQFDFPNEEGKPYKSSGGKMVWCEELKREIPYDFKIGSLYNIADFVNGLACQKFRPIDEKEYLPVIKITEMHNGITNSTEKASCDIPKKYIIDNGDILFSWSATLETMIWCGGKGALNQHIFKVIPKNDYKYYDYLTLSNYLGNFIKIAQSRKTTMGHITTEHLSQSRIAIPNNKLLYKFENIVKPIFENKINLEKENLELEKLKNFLLPLLMSSQVTIKDGN